MYLFLFVCAKLSIKFLKYSALLPGHVVRALKNLRIEDYFYFLEDIFVFLNPRLSAAK